MPIFVYSYRFLSGADRWPVPPEAQPGSGGAAGSAAPGQQTFSSFRIRLVPTLAVGKHRRRR